MGRGSGNRVFARFESKRIAGRRVRIRQAAQGLFRILGLDVHRLAKSPAHTLLGLRYLPIRTIIDVGANTGQFARRAREIFPSASLICFEPLPEAFAELSEWAKTCGDGRVKVLQRAIGEEAGVVKMFNHAEHNASSSLLATTTKATSLYPQLSNQVPAEVILTTLDKAVDEFAIDLQGDVLIKLDVQGYEDRVIRGGHATFERGRACIVEINLDGLYENQAEFLEIQHLLGNLGYRYAGNLEQTYDEDGHVVYFDAVFVRPDQKHRGAQSS